MSEEEKKVIEDFKKIIKQTEIANECGLSTNDFSEEIKTYNTVLNLIKSQQEELEKKDKIIDLILEEIAFDYEINSSEDVVTIKRQLKEKFEKKVEGKQC